MTFTLFKCVLLNDYVNKISIFKILIKDEEMAQSLKWFPWLKSSKDTNTMQSVELCTSVTNTWEVTSGEYLGYIAHLVHPNSWTSDSMRDNIWK